jgi:hypothetical protein
VERPEGKESQMRTNHTTRATPPWLLPLGETPSDTVLRFDPSLETAAAIAFRTDVDEHAAAPAAA